MSASEPLPSTADFGQLRAFVAVAEALNFSRAAEKLGVSSSALSQMVRGLEERVGVRLLHRNTRSVSLTQAGDRLFQRVRPALQELGVAIGQTSELRARGRHRSHSLLPGGRGPVPEAAAATLS